MKRISPVLTVISVSALLGSVCCSPPPEPEPVTGPRFARPLPQNVVQSENPPPAISGGTLHVTEDELYAIASDPDRDIVWLTPLVTSSGQALRDIPAGSLGSGISETLRLPTPLVLEPGAEPGRVAEIDEDEFLIVLRGRGEVLHAVIEGDTLQERGRREVCAEPRGVDFDANGRVAYVVCRGGNLIRYNPADPGSAIDSIHVAPDLRDVVVQGDRVYASTFRSAEIFVLNPAGARVGQLRLTSAIPDGDREPSVAWRMRAVDVNTIVVAHQLSRTSPEAEPVKVEPGGYGGGGGFECRGSSSIVIGATTTIRNGVVQGTRQAPGVVLPVDVASISMNEVGGPFGDLTLAEAGAIGEPFDVIDEGSRGLDDRGGPDIASPPGLCQGHVIRSFDDRRQVVAVDTLEAGWHVSQTRLPYQLVFTHTVEIFGDRIARPVYVVRFPGEIRPDTGHDLFHRDSGAGIACASCHPEGTDDGQVWQFEGLGERRTPQLRGGILAETAPFHWVGDMADFSHLSHEVFTERMGGPELTPVLNAVMERWIDTMPPLAPPIELDAASVARGAALFYSDETGCIDCHSGSHYTNNETMDVGTGEALQVPPLVGLVSRAPYMHDGCAATLAERFTDDACGGGDQHGTISHLNDVEVADLVSFLQTL